MARISQGVIIRVLIGIIMLLISWMMLAPVAFIAAQSNSSTPTATFSADDPRMSYGSVLATLRDLGAISTGGRLLFSVPDGYAITNSAGENFLPLGGGQIAQDFVLGAQIGWYTAGQGSACGLSFRASASDWRSLLFTKDGRLLLARQMASTRIIDAELPIPSFNPKPYKNALWLIVNGATITIYLDGQLQTTVIDETTRGGFALDVYNLAENAVVTDCRYRNLWIWSFDNATATPTLTTTTVKS